MHKDIFYLVNWSFKGDYDAEIEIVPSRAEVLDVTVSDLFAGFKSGMSNPRPEACGPRNERGAK